MGSRSLALFISLVCMAGSCMAQQACQASEVTIALSAPMAIVSAAWRRKTLLRLCRRNKSR